MSRVQRTMRCSRADVFAALLDPRTYPHWLVGARDIRDVDDDWPTPGSAFHHRVGLVGPLKVADHSKVLEIDEPELLSLEVRARPFGRGRSTFTLTEERMADGPATVVVLDEVPIGLIAPTRPLVDPLTTRRNRTSLAQLEDHVRTGASHRAPE